MLKLEQNENPVGPGDVLEFKGHAVAFGMLPLARYGSETEPYFLAADVLAIVNDPIGCNGTLSLDGMLATIDEEMTFLMPTEIDGEVRMEWFLNTWGMHAAFTQCRGELGRMIRELGIELENAARRRRAKIDARN